MNSPVEYLFVYGTLKLPEMQQHLVGRIIPGTPATLHGYHSYYQLDYPVALPQPGSSIKGLLLEITAAELARFDEYEGDTYQRVRVTLDSGLQAWLYQGDPAIYGPRLQGASET